MGHGSIAHSASPHGLRVRLIVNYDLFFVGEFRWHHGLHVIPEGGTREIGNGLFWCEIIALIWNRTITRLWKHAVLRKTPISKKTWNPAFNKTYELYWLMSKILQKYELSIGHSMQVNKYKLKKSTQNNRLTWCDLWHHSGHVHRRSWSKTR